MMASPSDQLTLDCKPHNSYSMLLQSFGEQSFNITDQTQKLEDFLSRLEQERLKIDAFKRELPLCMQLLTNAVESSRQQLQTYRANHGPQPNLEEFIPVRQSNSNGSEKTSSNIMSDKANWMTSAQLWSQTNDGTKQHSPKQTDIGFIFSPKLGLDAKQRNGGAFLPFSKERNYSCPSTLTPLPELALGSTDKLEIQVKKCTESTDNGMSCLRGENPSKGGSVGMGIELGKGAIVSEDSQTTTPTGTVATNKNSQAHRKARRCWSPDLHRRFVSALQSLGGSQGTPKQIRELMKVDGLTNDEVKSHLQKYRLHTRRPCPSPQAAGAPTPQLVVLGGIWVPQEFAAAHHGGAPTLYAPHPTIHHVASPHYPLPQEYYTPQPQGHYQLHHHTMHHQLHMYKPSPKTHSSPESEIRSNTGNRSESIDDGKSESSSWKAVSGGQENGGEGKGLVLREDGEESNGSDITLKF